MSQTTPFSGLVQVPTAVAKPIADKYVAARKALKKRVEDAERQYIEDTYKVTWWTRLFGYSTKREQYNADHRWDWIGFDKGATLANAGYLEEGEYVDHKLYELEYVFDLAELCTVDAEYVWVTPDQAGFIGRRMEKEDA